MSTGRPREVKSGTRLQGGRTKRQDATRKAEAVLAAAKRLFLQRGFDAVTMDAVARVAGVSKATLYAHFRSKEALFAAVVGAETARINSSMWPAAAEQGGDVAETLRQVARSFFAVFMNEQSFLMQRAVIGAMAHHPSLGRFVLEIGPDAFLGKIAAFLAAADEAGHLSLPDPKLAAAQFLSLASCDIRTRGFLSLDAPSEAEIDERVEGAVGMFMRFYGQKHACQ